MGLILETALGISVTGIGAGFVWMAGVNATIGGWKYTLWQLPLGAVCMVIGVALWV